MTTDETYNGHPNRETYMFHIHRSNDGYLYKTAQTVTRAVLANVNDPHPNYVGDLVIAAIRDEIEEAASSMDPRSLDIALSAMRDIGSWWRIDEHHVGETMLAEIAELDAYA